jgi:hypothetical protein
MLRARNIAGIPIIVLLAMNGCSSSQQSLSPENQKTVFAALTNLLTRTNQDSFVIFQERSSHKFVQFSASQAEGLQLDLPSQPLSPEELKRAKNMFKQIGVSFDTWQLLDQPGGKPVRDQSGFQLYLGKEIDRAAVLVSRVLLEVYRFPPTLELVVIEN